MHIEFMRLLALPNLAKFQYLLCKQNLQNCKCGTTIALSSLLWGDQERPTTPAIRKTQKVYAQSTAPLRRSDVFPSGRSCCTYFYPAQMGLGGELPGECRRGAVSPLSLQSLPVCFMKSLSIDGQCVIQFNENHQATEHFDKWPFQHVPPDFSLERTGARLSASRIHICPATAMVQVATTTSECFPGCYDTDFLSSMEPTLTDSDIQFTYRPLTVKDIGPFYDVRFSVKENRIHPHQVNLLDRDLLVEKIREGGGWLCEYRGEVVGVCLPVLIGKPFISALFVRPSCHAKGVGRELLERSVRWLRERGAKSVELVTDPGSRADGFYQHLGWQRHGLDDYGCQVVFTLDLS